MAQTESGNKLNLEEFSTMIEDEHAAELRSYFRACGLAVFSKSGFDGQLTRAELFSKPSRPCVRCGGDPIRGIPGTGLVPPEYDRAISETDRKRQTKPEVEDARYVVALLDFAEKCDDKLLASTMTCKRCKGSGWVHRAWTTRQGEITAFPTGSSVKRGSSGVNVSDTALHALAVVSRRLALAVALMPSCEDVMAAVFGPDFGGMLNVWPMTQAGKTLLKRNGLKLEPLSFLANERASQEQNPDRNRRMLFESCDAQSKALFDMACRAWNAAVYYAESWQCDR